MDFSKTVLYFCNLLVFTKDLGVLDSGNEVVSATTKCQLLYSNQERKNQEHLLRSFS